MLKFASLSLAQKRFVVSMIEANPSVRTNSKVTLKDCSAHYNAMAAERDSTGIKLGVPNWLFKANKIDRGVYQLPIPNALELTQYEKELAQKSTPKVAKTKAVKVAKVVKAKAPAKKVVAPVATDVDEDEVEISGSRLNKIIAESEFIDEDVEDFNEILRQNGIEV
jgi:hypothetical protein